MRYMRWGYPQLMACPESYVKIIAEEAKRENDARKRAAKGY